MQVDVMARTPLRAKSWSSWAVHEVTAIFNYDYASVSVRLWHAIHQQKATGLFKQRQAPAGALPACWRPQGFKAQARHDQATARHSKAGQAEVSQVRPAQADGATRLEQRLRAGVRGGEAHVQRGRALQRVEVPAARRQRVAQRVHVQAAHAGSGVGRHEAHHRHGGLAGQAQLGDGAHALRKVGRDLRCQC